jgi:hypothetical protein
MGQQVNVYRKLKFFPGAIVEGSWNGLYDKRGMTYYVNNITGASTNPGTSWDAAFDQLSTAITASEAWVDKQTTNNQYIRPTIVVQGTATAYSAIAALPNYTDIIGLGADPRGNGAGIARLDGAGAADAAASAGCRGIDLYNLQFTGSGNFYAMDLALIFRSVFENCAFVNCAYGGMRIVTGGGIVIRDCHFGGDTTTPATGLYIGSGSHNGNFNQSLVEDCVIYGSTNGVLIDTYLNDGTCFRNNTIYGGTYAIRDTSTETTIAGNAFYMGNYVAGGTNSISIASTGNAAYQALGNWASDAGTVDIVTNLAAQT